MVVGQGATVLRDSEAEILDLHSRLSTPDQRQGGAIHPVCVA